MVTVWWSAAHLIHYSFLNSSETITFENYAQQIDEKHWKLQCLQPALDNKKGPVVIHDKAQPHVTQPTHQKLNELGYKVLLHQDMNLSKLLEIVNDREACRAVGHGVSKSHT